MAAPHGPAERSDRLSVFHFDQAIVRTPGRSVVDGLRAGDHPGPAYEAVADEHRAYVTALEMAGVAVETLPALEAFPDSMFVEDPALVFAEGAILLRPGAPSRMDEASHLEPVLRRRFEQVARLAEGFADGGDVLVTPDLVYVGLSARTDVDGAAALINQLAAFGYQGRAVTPPPGVLHLKTASSLIDDETVLATAAVDAAGIFDGLRVLVVPEGEEGAANVLRVNDVVLAAAAYPRTLDLLARHGLTVRPLAVSEVAKIDAGLTCMSLRWANRR